jgi:glutaredoxin
LVAYRAALVVALGALFTALPAQALYKVVGPDGKVTYTDRLTGPESGKVTPLSATGSTATDSAALPPELQKAVERYPVTLFITADCAPCDNARALLRQRGIPHNEKIVQSGDDADALQRLTGTRDVPTLLIGVQAVPGLSPESWNAYLNAAGYPRESKLPAGYEFPAPLPMRTGVAVSAPAVAPPTSTDAPAAPPLRNANGIRF